MGDEIRDSAITVLQELTENSRDEEARGMLQALIEFMKLDEKLKKKDYFRVAKEWDVRSRQQKELDDFVSNI